MQQQSTNLRLVAAGLLGGSSALMAIYGSSQGFIVKSDMATQKAYTIGNLYQLVHAIAIATIATTAAKAKGAPACDLCIASWCFAAGSVVLAGTRYVQCLAASRSHWLVRVTQLGGVVTAIGWSFVIAAAVNGARA